MSPQVESIIALSNQGMPVQEIAEAMAVSLAIVKAALNKSADITEEEEAELKNILLDHARGNMMNGTAETTVQCAIYLHKTSTENRRIKGSHQGTKELMEMLKEKAKRRMEEIDITPETTELIQQ